MTDWAKVAEGRRIIEAGGGFGVVTWTAGDITGLEGFEGDLAEAADWLQNNQKYLRDYLIEKGNQYIANECEWLNGEGEAEEAEGETVARPDFASIERGWQIVEEAGGLATVIWSIGDIVDLEDFAGTQDQAWDWICDNEHGLVDYLVEKGNFYLAEAWENGIVAGG